MTGKKILIIDDDVELCEEMADFLQSEKYAVEFISDGLKSKELLGRNAYDIIIVDYKMQDITGVDLLDFIKPGTAVILITGKPLINELLQSKNLLNSIKAVISKPFTLETLLAKIKEC